MIIPKGNILAVSPSQTHHLEEVYKEPMKFDPDRFNKERAEHEKFKTGYISFGSGSHKCIGENFAFLQSRTILSVFLRNLDLKLEGKFPSIDYTSLVTGPKYEECWISFKKKK